MSITDWPEDQRPRERLITQGAAALSDAELIAVFLRVGVKGKSAVDLGREMLQHFGSLRALFNASLSNFSAVNGLGPAKYAQLQGIMELAKRALSEELQMGIQMDSPKTVKQYLQLLLGGKPHESFAVLFLDIQNRLIAGVELFRGTLTYANVYPREIVKATLTHNAANVIFAHNHPSGKAEPSNADKTITHTLKKALSLIDVQVLDHFIVAGADIYSFSEHGIL